MESGGDDALVRNLRMGMELTKRAVEPIIGVLGEDSAAQNEALSLLRKAMEKYINSEKEYMDTIDAITNVRCLLRERPEGQSTEDQLDVDAALDNELAKLPKVARNYVETHESMAAMEAKIKALAVVKREGDDDGVPLEGQDDDIVMTQAAVSTQDPITKLTMTDPVKNLLCGHVYERNSILELVRKNKSTKCPIAGCPNNKPVTPADLIDDSEMKMMLEKGGKKSKKK